MKYTAKHPDGATYDLTIEELQMPHLVKQLQISPLWTVLVNGEWMALPSFLESKDNIISQEEESTKGKDINYVLSADAPWTPGSVFGLIVRLFGLYLVWQGFVACVALGMNSGNANPESYLQVWLSIPFSFLSPFGLYFFFGLYLLLKPHRLVSSVFSARS